jgi:hypothetical protein
MGHLWAVLLDSIRSGVHVDLRPPAPCNDIYLQPIHTAPVAWRALAILWITHPGDVIPDELVAQHESHQDLPLNQRFDLRQELRPRCFPVGPHLLAPHLLASVGSRGDRGVGDSLEEGAGNLQTARSAAERTRHNRLTGFQQVMREMVQKAAAPTSQGPWSRYRMLRFARATATGPHSSMVPASCAIRTSSNT